MTHVTAYSQRYTTMLRDFFKMGAAGGIVLFAAAISAIILANAGYGALYRSLLDTPASVSIGSFAIAKPVFLWINDGLMAVFFFLVGLEIKREFKVGELAGLNRVALPGIAAVGGIIVPAGIYALINWQSPQNLNGWAIPAATDIAFALAVVALLGTRVPANLKLLLLAIAIFDDLGAIIIIAIFYTQQLSIQSLALAIFPVAGLLLLNLRGVVRLAPYVVLGVLLWVLVLKSGVHATLAGVITALAVPLLKRDGATQSVLEEAEHGLHRWVAFLILPLFAFANAGVSFAGIGVHSFIEPVRLGIALGLFVGKQLGIFGMLWVAIKLGIAPMPRGVSWLQLYGVSVLAGIGFTMSLFIGTLAFQHSDFEAPIRMGVFAGSLLSAVVGYVILMLARAPE